MIYLIDNYDSFSYNLYQLLGSIRNDICVIRNDTISVEELVGTAPEAVVLSPGPGKPSDAGICEQAILALPETTPILGICLGHQAICEALGATVGYADKVMHGKSSPILLDTKCPLFAGIDSPMRAGRYHSLAVKRQTLPEELAVVAESPTGEVMGVAHRSRPIFGLQFHPESILTPKGIQIAKNFMSLVPS
jgi:anthranilate synthase component 2